MTGRLLEIDSHQSHSVEGVSRIKSILSVKYHTIYGVVWIQLTHLSHGDCQNACTLSYCHYQIGSMSDMNY